MTGEGVPVLTARQRKGPQPRGKLQRGDAGTQGRDLVRAAGRCVAPSPEVGAVSQSRRLGARTGGGCLRRRPVGDRGSDAVCSGRPPARLQAPGASVRSGSGGPCAKGQHGLLGRPGTVLCPAMDPGRCFCPVDGHSEEESSDGGDKDPLPAEHRAGARSEFRAELRPCVRHCPHLLSRLSLGCPVRVIMSQEPSVGRCDRTCGTARRGAWREVAGHGWQPARASCPVAHVTWGSTVSATSRL